MSRKCETVGHLLEARLREGGLDAEVINAAVIGATIAQGIERFRGDVAPLQPDLVIACYGTVNEAIPAQQIMDFPKIALLKDRARGSALGRWFGDLYGRWDFDGDVASRVSGDEQRPPAASEEETRAEGWFQPEWPWARRVSLGEYASAMIDTE